MNLPADPFRAAKVSGAGSVAGYRALMLRIQGEDPDGRVLVIASH